MRIQRPESPWRQAGLAWLWVAAMIVVPWSNPRINAQETSAPLGSTATLDGLSGKPAKESKPSKGQSKDESGPDLRVEAVGEPSPPLKYRFYPTPDQLRPGSAYLHFSRATLLHQQIPEENRKKFDQFYVSYDSASGEKIAPQLIPFQSVLHELESFYVCEDLSWDHRIRDLKGPEIYAVLLPEVQEARALARVLTFQVRAKLQEGKFEEAVHSISIGYRLAEHLHYGETLIQQLVGLAIQNMMIGLVHEAMETPGCPNLYWALATLPPSFSNIRRSVEIELHAMTEMLPVLAQAESDSLSDDAWEKLWAESMEGVKSLQADPNLKIPTMLSILAGASDAKKRILAAGYSAQRVDEMCPQQLIALDGLIEIRNASQEFAKFFYLPTSTARNRMKGSRDAFELALRNRPMTFGASILHLLLPSLGAVEQAEYRTQSFLYRAMTAEAVRMHAATHGGQLPKTLADLDPVPAMLDPYTQKDFEYSVSETDRERIVSIKAAVPAYMAQLGELKMRFPKTK